MEFHKFRDLHVGALHDGMEMVVACDSLGGIGPLEFDPVSCSAEISGYFAALVTLAELLAYGAAPILLVDNLCFPMEPHGKDTIEGVRRALTEAGFAHCPITGSTEENIPVKQTAVGITVLGLASVENRKRRLLRSGDVCYLIGQPLVGDEVLENLDHIKTLENLRVFHREDFIGDLLPVGSKGIRVEMMEMGKTHDVEWIFEDLEPFFLDRSAGPATCFLAAGKKDMLERILRKNELTPIKIGVVR